MNDLDHLTKLLLELPGDASVRATIHANDDNARAVLVAAEAVFGELPEPARLNATTYTIDVGRATIFLPATFVVVEPEPRPEPKVRPMAELLAGA
ncbi:MAG: hypothetical protein EKK62_07730 [Acidimicrobiia bacterium]|nr:MAG: hypothetical protein EKK62_07730 [Acidimicrobiia bacterium]